MFITLLRCLLIAWVIFCVKFLLIFGIAKHEQLPVVQLFSVRSKPCVMSFCWTLQMLIHICSLRTILQADFLFFLLRSYFDSRSVTCKTNHVWYNIYLFQTHNHRLFVYVVTYFFVWCNQGGWDWQCTWHAWERKDKLWWKSAKQRESLADVGVNGGVILYWVSKK